MPTRDDPGAFTLESAAEIPSALAQLPAQHTAPRPCPSGLKAETLGAFERVEVALDAHHFTGTGGWEPLVEMAETLAGMVQTLRNPALGTGYLRKGAMIGAELEQKCR